MAPIGRELTSVKEELKESELTLMTSPTQSGTKPRVTKDYDSPEATKLKSVRSSVTPPALLTSSPVER